MIEQEKVPFQFQFKLSRLSKISGLLLLVTVVMLAVLVIGTGASVNDILFRVVAGVLVVELLVFFLGLIKDRLATRLAALEFEPLAFWSIVSYAGIMLVFSPLVLWIAFNRLVLDLSIVLASIGLFVFFFGFLSETRELDKTFTRSLMTFISALKAYDYRKGIKGFFDLLKRATSGFLAYLGNGFLSLKEAVKKFVSGVFNAPKVVIVAAVSFILWVPQVTARSARLLLRHFEKIGFVASIILVSRSFSEPPSPLRADFNLSVSLLVMSAVLITVKTAYLHEERFTALVATIRDGTWETGYKLNYRLKTAGGTRKKITCTDCGELLPLDSRVCSKCGREIDRCMICRLPLEHGQEQASCQHCSNIAHRDHWNSWLTRKDTCPACLQEVKG